MRTLNLRIWDIIDKKFTYPPTSRFLIGLDGKLFDGSGYSLDSSRFIIDECSGVPDNTGTNIYENDIIRYTYSDNSSHTGYVEYSSGSFRCNWPDQTDDDISYMLTKSMEVIGHTHK